MTPKLTLAIRNLQRALDEDLDQLNFDQRQHAEKLQESLVLLVSG